MPLDDVIGPDDPFPGDKVGQPVVVEGTWVPDGTVCVSGREHDGTTGYWVVTPVVTARRGSALPVVRGWVATPTQAPGRRPGHAELVGCCSRPRAPARRTTTRPTTCSRSCGSPT